MNLFRQIEKLNKKVKLLEEENKKLRDENKTALELKNNYEVKLKALEHKEIEYCKLLQSLLDAKNEYEELIRQTKEIKTNLNYTYKKAFSDVKRDLVKH